MQLLRISAKGKLPNRRLPQSYCRPNRLLLFILSSTILPFPAYYVIHSNALRTTVGTVIPLSDVRAPVIPRMSFYVMIPLDVRFHGPAEV